jgi:hypothetical protein
MRLCCDEWCKYVVSGTLLYANTRIFDYKSHIPFHGRTAQEQSTFTVSDFVHCLNRVDYQIENYLLYLNPIAPHRTPTGNCIRIDPDGVLLKLAPRKQQRFRDRVAQVERRKRRSRLFDQRPQASHYVVCTSTVELNPL